nr:DUF2247 family protein [Bacillus sp. 2CMS4F]
MVLKDIYNYSSDDIMFSNIENIFSIFNKPEHMHNFFRNVSDAFYYPSDSKYTVKELLKEFLETEREIILFKVRLENTHCLACVKSTPPNGE